MNNYINLTKKEMFNIIKNNNICFASVCDSEKSYIIPIEYHFDWKNSVIIMKSNIDGLKMHYLKNNENITILIINRDLGIFDSVIIYGIANVELHSNNSCHIIIEIENATGRRFSF